jgi:hypothetical protein
MRPVCVECKREMKCEKNGVEVIHYMEHPEPDAPAYEDRDNVRIVNVDVLLEGQWEEGEIDWVKQGDKYKCPVCNKEIITGFGGALENWEIRNMEDPKRFYAFIAQRVAEGKAIALKTK